jgi:predicted glycosyltransferase
MTESLMRPDRGPRILVYSHDTYGLGHLRRSLLISEHLSSRLPEASVLIVTGSSRARSFPLADGCDTLKLPSVIKQPDGGYLPRTLRVSLDVIRRLRSEMIVAAVRSFDPDLFLVDHAPAGMEGELLPVFASLKQRSRPCRLVLGLRDVIDDAAKVREEWDRLGVPGLLEETYDDILVYGDPALPTTAQELDLPRLHEGRVEHMGYVARTPNPSMGRAAVGTRPYVLVTTGGGGDGREVLAAYASYLESLDTAASFRSVVVAGPLLSDSRFREIRARLAATRSSVEIFGFTEHMEALTGQASAIIAMAGYNTAVEVLSSRVPALFLPRSTPRAEQTIRAKRLARLSGIEWCPVADATPELIGAFVRRALASGPLPEPRVDLGGLPRVSSFLERALGSETSEADPRARTAG